MAAVGAIYLLVFGFDSHGELPPAVETHLRQLHGHGVIRLLDALFVSRDERGVLRVERDAATLGLGAGPPESALWRLLNGPEDDVAMTPFELHSSGEVGLDLEAVESLAYQVGLGTSALLLLVETRWVTDLLDRVVGEGGFPVRFGCLEPETMLIVGPDVAAAMEARAAQDAVASADGASTLDQLTVAADLSTAAADVLRILVDACVVDPTDVDEAISTLADAGLVPSIPKRRDPPARDRSDRRT